MKNFNYWYSCEHFDGNVVIMKWVLIIFSIQMYTIKTSSLILFLLHFECVQFEDCGYSCYSWKKLYLWNFVITIYNHGWLCFACLVKYLVLLCLMHVPIYVVFRRVMVQLSGHMNSESMIFVEINISMLNCSQHYGLWMSSFSVIGFL